MGDGTLNPIRPSGVGKTRLAAELAHRAVDAGGRVVFTELGRVTAADGVVDAIFDALGLPAVARRDQLHGLVRLLRADPALLVLDNCEHLVDAVAATVQELLRELPRLTVLATSRETLGLPGEQTYRLRPLDEASAVHLFLDRAAASGATVALEPEEREQVLEICRRLDGIPLAIEFAAARVAHMGLADLGRRLDERFWLLTGGQRAVARHQTLEAVIGWSHDLLDDAERAILRAAGAFVDGFTVGALAEVAGVDERAALDAVASLAAKSLVEVDVVPSGVARYHLLETVRLFALQRLHDEGEAETVRRAHAHHFLRRALSAAPRIEDLPTGVDRSMCRIRLDPTPEGASADLGNHLAALSWLDREGDLADVGKLAARVPTVLGYADHLDPNRRHLGRDDVADTLVDEPAELALYGTASALNACCLGAWSEARRFGEAAMASSTDAATRSAAAALTALADVGLAPDEVADLVDRALTEAPRQARFTRLLLRGQRSLSRIMQGRLDDAVAQLEPHARLGDAFAAAEQLLVLHVLGDDERAAGIRVPDHAYPGAVALWGYRWPLARALAHAARGEREPAAAALVEARRRVAVSPVAHEHDILLGCAALALHDGAPARALELVRAVGSRLISPGSFVLAKHYGALAHAATDAAARDAVLELADALDPGQLLRREMGDLARHAEPATTG